MMGDRKAAAPGYNTKEIEMPYIQMGIVCQFGELFWGNQTQKDKVVVKKYIDLLFVSTVCGANDTTL